MNRILIVRLGSLGDIVNALPAAAALRQAFPHARLDWVVDVRHREILDLVPVIDRRIVIGAARARPVERDGEGSSLVFAGTAGLVDAIRELRLEDEAGELHANWPANVGHASTVPPSRGVYQIPGSLAAH